MSEQEGRVRQGLIPQGCMFITLPAIPNPEDPDRYAGLMSTEMQFGEGRLSDFR
jgi:hypothetical protein